MGGAGRKFVKEKYDINDDIYGNIMVAVNEAVNNAIKHGKSREICIDIRAEKDRIALTVADDGLGFSKGAKRHQGMGLRIMKYRASALAATLDIASKPNSGSRVTCTVPLHGTSSTN